MTESYTHFHNPRVGRHGVMVEMKHDYPFCITARDGLVNGKNYHGSPLNGYELHTYRERAADENDTCVCDPHRTGAVWSLIMSHEVDEDVWNDRMPRRSADEIRWDQEENDDFVRYEERYARAIEITTHSYAHGVHDKSLWIEF